jgi:hypothetical protein
MIDNPYFAQQGKVSSTQHVLLDSSCKEVVRLVVLDTRFGFTKVSRKWV